MIRLLLVPLLLAMALTPRAVASDASPPLTLEQTVRDGDRFLFAGDELTQQMFYTRATAAALLALFPDHDLRFFNGGKEGATAASALMWIEELLELTRPTVVFVCFGLNDAQASAVGPEQVQSYRQHLDQLLERLAARPGVRQLMVLGPPAVQVELTQRLDPRSYNAGLLGLSGAAREVAAARGAAFIDLFDHTSAVYLGQMESGAEPLTLGGRLPTESGHTVIASIVLRGIGVRGEQLNHIGWSPLVPRRMSAVRPALALKTTPPSLEAAQASRDLYESIVRFDETFFRLWRLAGARPSAPTRGSLQAEADQAWAQVRQAVPGRSGAAR